MLDPTIRPSDIQLKQHWDTTLLDHQAELAARDVVAYLQEHGDSWEPFDYDDLDQWLTDQGKPGRPGVPRLGWLTDSLLYVEDDTIHPTPEFVTACFKAAGRLRPRQDPTDQTLREFVQEGVRAFENATAHALARMLTDFGCPDAIVRRGPARVALQDTCGRPLIVTVWLDGDTTLHTTTRWLDAAHTPDDVHLQLPLGDNDTPEDAADIAACHLIDHHPHAQDALGLPRNLPTI